MLSTRKLRVAAGLAVSALVAVVAVSTGTSATSQSAKIVIWADADRVPAVTKVANAWAASKGVTVQVVQKQSGPDSPGSLHGRRRHRAGRHRRCARLGRRAVGQRLDHPALAVSGDEEAVPRVRAQCVLVRDRDQEALRCSRRAREHRARHEHEAREGPEVVRRPREAGPRGEEEDEVSGRPRRAAGAG